MSVPHYKKNLLKWNQLHIDVAQDIGIDNDDIDAYLEISHLIRHLAQKMNDIPTLEQCLNICETFEKMDRKFM